MVGSIQQSTDGFGEICKTVFVKELQCVTAAPGGSILTLRMLQMILKLAFIFDVKKTKIKVL